MSKMKKLLAIIFVMILSFGTFSETASAAYAYQGYAVYRDGVLFNYTWHAAFMDDPYYNSTSYPVIHQPGSGYVQWGTWSQFLGSNSFQGVYSPKGSPSPYSRDLFHAMGRNLLTEYITYTPLFQIDYNPSSTGTYVYPNNISSMRCDGVIEYIYEWYGFRVFGDNNWWDITYNNAYARSQHSGTYVTPSKQANYLDRVTAIMWPQVYYQYGSTGDVVAYIQSRLNALGFWCGYADGIFGNMTRNAVINFQNSRGLGADGIVGFYTWNELFR